MLSSTDWLAIVAGVATIGWVNWYFFIAERGAATAVADSGPAEVTVVVRGGYDPATIHVKVGAPTRIIFDRQETASCSEEVVFADFDVRRFLPAHRKTTVEITPKTPGTYEFTCGMSMLHGKLIAE